MAPTTRSQAKKENTPPFSLKFCLFSLVVVNVLGKISDVFVLVLGNLPTLLLALNANDFNLTLAAALDVPFWKLFVVGVTRRVAEDVLYFFTAAWHGSAVEQWVERRKGKRGLDRAKRLIDRYGVPLLVLLPGSLTCFCYGMSKGGKARKTFLVLDAFGAGTRVITFRAAGKGAKRNVRRRPTRAHVRGACVIQAPKHL